MSELNFSIEFRGTANAIATFKPMLEAYLQTCGSQQDKRIAYSLLMGNDIDPETNRVITNDTLFDIMPNMDFQFTGRDTYLETKGQFDHLDFSGSTYDIYIPIWRLVADKYNLDFEITWTGEDGEFTAGEFVYINKVLNDTEIIVDDLYDAQGDELCNYEEPMFDGNGNDIGNFYDYMRQQVINTRGNKYATFDFTPVIPVVLIDCETNYLDNLKSFVDNNITIPKLDEHLVKSGLFKTIIGTEKRKRIEVEVNGVKLFADSKPAVKQRKSNVKKLEKLLTA